MSSKITEIFIRRHFLKYTKFCDQRVLKKKKIFSVGLKAGVCVTFKTASVPLISFLL